MMGIEVLATPILPAEKRKSYLFWSTRLKLYWPDSVSFRRQRRDETSEMSLVIPHREVRPITAVAWTSNTSTCPKDFTLISITEDGAAANFTRSFAMKSGYYLCYSKDLTGGMVVSEIQLISDKDSIPHGYCYIAEHLEPRATVSKKKRVCVRLVPTGSVDTAVLDIKLTAKSKMMLQHYTYVGDVHGYVLWCKKGPFSSPVPQAKPRRVSLDIQKLSLDQSTPLFPFKPSNPPPLPPGRLSHRRHNLNVKDELDKPVDGSLQGITALDGVPFSLHSKFDAPANSNSSQLSSQLNSIRIKSIQDIENEYNYTFAVEEIVTNKTKPSAS